MPADAVLLEANAAARGNRLTHEGLLAKVEAESRGRNFLLDGGARGGSSGRRCGAGRGLGEGPRHNEGRTGQWRQRDSGDRTRPGW